MSAPSGRLVLVVEYRADLVTPEIVAEIGRLVRDRLVSEQIAGAVFVAAHAAIGRVAFRILEELPSPKS